MEIEGDFEDGDSLADAVFARMPDLKEWHHLFVSVQLSASNHSTHQKNAIGSAGIRSRIRHDFDELKTRLNEYHELAQ